MSLLGKAMFGASAGLGLAGAATGAVAYGGTNRDIGEGALIGGAMGAVALPAAVGVGKAAASIAGVAGSAYLNAGASAVRAAPGALLGTAAFATKMINGVGTSGGLLDVFAGRGIAGSMSTVASPIRRHVNAVGGFGSKLVNWNTDSGGTLRSTKRQTLLGKATDTQGVKLTGLGKATLWGGAIGAGVTSAFQEFNESRMGSSDGQVSRATPRTPSYDLNAGATGDLVFALNANRRG
jgi:hypothetical protein